MLEYFAYKKIQKRKAQKEVDEKLASTPATPTTPTATATAAPEPADTTVPAAHEPVDIPSPPAPVLSPHDEDFLAIILAEVEGERPPLPPRRTMIDSDSEDNTPATSAAPAAAAATPAKEQHLKKKGRIATLFADDTKPDTDKTNKKSNRLSFLFRKDTKPESMALVKHSNPTSTTSDEPAVAAAAQVTPPETPPATALTPEEEEKREREDLSRVLEDLNLSAANNRAFSLSAESTELSRKFTVVLRDLIDGVPTAYDDLTSLIEDRDGTLNKAFDRLPSSLKKLVAQLPDKLTGNLAPEVLAAAAESQGIKGVATDAGFKEGFKRLLTPGNLQELVTKPGALVTMLKAIVNTLKLRWPAFIGTNIIWSISIFLLLFVLWYCHKRGKEVRLERERTVDGSGRIEELPDDPTLPAPKPQRKPSQSSKRREPARRLQSSSSVASAASSSSRR